MRRGDYLARSGGLAPPNALLRQHGRPLRRARPRVWLQALFRPGRGPVVVPTEDRPQDRGEIAEQGTIRVHDPVEADVDLAVAVGRERPLAGPGQVAHDLDLEVGGRIEDDDLRGGLERVGELALEVLLRRHARTGLLVSLDLDVGGLPPIWIGAGVGERVEDRLLRRVDVPLVEEHVLLGHLSSTVAGYMSNSKLASTQIIHRSGRRLILPWGVV